MNIEELIASLPDKERSNINEQKFTQGIPDVQYANGGQLKEWKTLSMRERANIIRNSVQNHFANGGSMTDISIDDIRHQYEKGGEEDIYTKANALLDERMRQQMMENRPSYEDWINRERNKVTQAAFEYSNQRTSPSYVMQDNPYKTEEEWTSAMNSIIAKRQKELNDSIRLNANQPPMTQKMNVSIAQQKLDDAIWEKNQGYSSKIPANSCLTTATDNYVQVTGDKSYGANLNSYFQNSHPGYKVVPGFEDAAYGDIVQLLEDNGEAKHGMIYAGQNDQGQYIFNNSNGGSEDIAYKKGISFHSINTDKNPNDHVQILRFIGNDKWNEEKEKDYNLRYPAFMQGGNLFDEGGNTLTNEAQPKNNWRKDSPNKREYIKDLDEWIAKNPTFKGSNGAVYNTADFRDMFIQLVGHESSYRPNASTGSYTGYYQIHKNENPTLNQHARAFKHIDRLFQDNITDYDLNRAKELGINQAALLMKYWNQGNHVNNYLHNGIDHEDGAGTKISLYGNDMDADFDMTNYVSKAITDNYALVPKGGNLWNIAKLARNKNITNYADQKNLITAYTKEHNPSFGNKALQIGDTIWLTPTNIPEEPVIPQKVKESQEVPQTDSKVNYDNPHGLPWYNVLWDDVKRVFGWEPPEGRYDLARGGCLNNRYRRY